MLTGLGASQAFSVVLRQGDALEARFASQKTLAREEERFRARAAELATPEALLRDRRSLEFVLQAYGLEGEIGKTAILRKLMTQDPDATGSLAGTMVDPRYRQFARDMSGWDGTSGPPLQRAGAVDGLIEKWRTARFEVRMGEDSPGLREALYFRRVAPDKTSVVEMMGDPALVYVLRMAAGLPRQFGTLDYDQQRTLLEKRIDMETFSDPKRLDQFIRRFLVRYEIENGSGQADSGGIATLLSGSGSTSGLFSLLGSTLNLRV
jgi:hypothetical protein